MSSSIDSGEFRSVCHGDVELRFYVPIAWEVRRGWQEGQFTCVLREPVLAARMRERLNHGRGTTASGALKSLQRKLLRVVLSGSCPTLIASLVEHVGPREHDSRIPVTEMLKLALLAQWLCVEERRGRVFSEVTIRQDPLSPPCGISPSYRLDLVLLETGNTEVPARVTAVEIKSSRADFSGDRKWRNYIGRADRLVIATLPGVVKPGELPEGVGLLELQQDTESGFFERVLSPLETKVSAEARIDLLYGVAACDRLCASGLDLYERARAAVANHWDNLPRRRKAVRQGV